MKPRKLYSLYEELLEEWDNSGWNCTCFKMDDIFNNSDFQIIHKHFYSMKQVAIDKFGAREDTFWWKHSDSRRKEFSEYLYKLCKEQNI